MTAQPELNNLQGLLKLKEAETLELAAATAAQAKYTRFDPTVTEAAAGSVAVVHLLQQEAAALALASSSGHVSRSKPSACNLCLPLL